MTLSAMKDDLTCEKMCMLDTYICSFIIREQSEAVLKRLEQAVLRGHRIVVLAITYSEMRFGATGPKISPRHVQLVDEFCARIDVVLPWPAPRWTLPQILRSRCAWPGRRSARTTR
jgi:tRNA(fMet)-specific endonuclease VapC